MESDYSCLGDIVACDRVEWMLMQMAKEVTVVLFRAVLLRAPGPESPANAAMFGRQTHIPIILKSGKCFPWCLTPIWTNGGNLKNRRNTRRQTYDIYDVGTAIKSQWIGSCLVQDTLKIAPQKTLWLPVAILPNTYFYCASLGFSVTASRRPWSMTWHELWSPDSGA